MLVKLPFSPKLFENAIASPAFHAFTCSSTIARIWPSSVALACAALGAGAVTRTSAAAMDTRAVRIAVLRGLGDGGGCYARSSEDAITLTAEWLPNGPRLSCGAKPEH